MRTQSGWAARLTSSVQNQHKLPRHTVQTRGTHSGCLNSDHYHISTHSLMTTDRLSHKVVRTRSILLMKAGKLKHTLTTESLARITQSILVAFPITDARRRQSFSVLAMPSRPANFFRPKDPHVLRPPGQRWFPEAYLAVTIVEGMPAGHVRPVHQPDDAQRRNDRQRERIPLP